mmetsp:Transcript_21432/g.27718  ORF Transcript_21432/g.27718 Transcript_21432/m.27718 type:complete len:318 (-) Transcript_21432:162-1115(-)
MAPPAAKLRKRKNKKTDAKADDEVIDMFGTSGGGGKSDFDFPMPPSMGGGSKEEVTKEKVNVKDSDDEDDDVDDLPAPSRQSKRKGRAAGPNDNIKLASANSGIKWGPVIMLIVMFGTTLIPAVIFLGDHVSGFLAKNDIMGSVGYQLGIGAVPKKRVVSFYEKHNPEKLNDVPKVLATHYGDYPKLIRKLERKYNDYGYFMGWEEDESPMRLMKDSLGDMYSVWIQQYWNKYAPVMIRTRVRNIKYNLMSVHKQGRKIWRKHIWPILEPFFGVPDERAAAKQKRKDASMANEKKKQRSGPSSTRRKNTDFRDDVED